MSARWYRGPVLAHGPLPTPTAQTAVDLVFQALPAASFQGWGTFSLFVPGRDDDEEPDSMLELDLLVLGPYALYLMEIKEWSGRISGAGPTWVLEHEGARKEVQNPLPLLARKARLLKQALIYEDPALRQLWVEPLLFLPNADVDPVLLPQERRQVVTRRDLVRVFQLEERPSAADAPELSPPGDATIKAAARALNGLRRYRRPGYGSLAEDLPLLHRELSHDLREEVSSAGSDRETRVEQAAATWIIACAFLRVLEDRGLCEQRLAGEGAERAERTFLAQNPTRTLRDYLAWMLEEVARTPAGEAVLGPCLDALASQIPTSAGARALLTFFRERGSLSAPWVDLFQDLSTPRPLATPRFVSRFLVRLTLPPALDERGAATVRVLDPACGSGTLLLEALEQILALRERTEPDIAPCERVQASLGQVYGVDINPVAVLVARAGLVVAALDHLRRSGFERPGDIPPLRVHVGTADTLLGSSEAADAEAALILDQQYDVVVASPPSGPCEDTSRATQYKARYVSAHGEQWSLTTVFAERCIALTAPGGLFGLLVPRGFMEAEYGAAFVQDVLPRVELTRVIDASGAYLPGRSLPQVILVGRRQAPTSGAVRVVVAKRREPMTPPVPERGRLWTSITAHADEAGYEDDDIAVADVPQERLERHPWRLPTSGAEDLFRRLDERSSRTLREITTRITGGASPATHDWGEIIILDPDVASRLRIEPEAMRPLLRWWSIKGWTSEPTQLALLPPREPEHVPHGPAPSAGPARWPRFLWPYRALSGARRDHETEGQDRGLWLGAVGAQLDGLCLVGSGIGGACDFAAASDGCIAHAGVWVLRMRADAAEEEILALLGYLNSSTARFWMKEHPNPSRLSPLGPFSTVIPMDLPVPREILQPGPVRAEIAALAHRLHAAARERLECSPERAIERWDRASWNTLLLTFADARQRARRLLRQMIVDQEDLDWKVYAILGLTTEEQSRRAEGLALSSERPFAWLSERPPARLDPRLRQVWIERRRALGAQAPALRMLESASVKRDFEALREGRDEGRGVELDREPDELPPGGRRFTGRSGEDRSRRIALVCGRWLLDRLEEELRALEPPRGLTAHALRMRLERVEGARAVASRYAESRQVDLDAVTEELLAGNAVPYLAALRYTETGLEKRARWEEIWALQDRSDAGEKVELPAPRRYEPGDYRQSVLWELRGSLDVPRERFIAYPHAAPGGGETLYGWAGWDEEQRAAALRAMVDEQERHGAIPSRIAPLLAGLLELLPWLARLRRAAGGPLDTIEECRRIEDGARGLGMTIEDLRAFRPEAPPARALPLGTTEQREVMDEPVERRSSTRMRIEKLDLGGFTVFEEVHLDFAPGINVLIGENGTGKSHLLKLIYALLKEAGGRSTADDEREHSLRAQLADVFRPEDSLIGRLVRAGAEPARLRLTSDGGTTACEVSPQGDVTLVERAWSGAPDVLFIPSRDVLAMFEGFIPTYEDRELSFDVTYFDICVALQRLKLRGDAKAAADKLAAPIHALLGGSVELRGTRFYVDLGDGPREAHLVAEGLRKIAALAQLAQNGSIKAGGILLWDEPEANLNPKYIARLAEILLGLSRGGVQIILATHDYLLSHLLSLAVEQDAPGTSEMRFFSLHHERLLDPVEVETGSTLAHIEHNVILDEYASYYDRQRELFAQSVDIGHKVNDG